MKKIPLILSLILFVACQGNDDQLLPSGKGYIQLSLSADDDQPTRAIQDVSNVGTWYAVLMNATGEILYDRQIGTELSTIPFEAGMYSVSVRNFNDMAEANLSDEGWGSAYHEGEATDVELSAGGTSYVHVNCGRALNAKFALNVAEFSGIVNTVTIYAPRSVVFSYANGTLSREAFFAPQTMLTYTINYTLGTETKTTEPQVLTLGDAATVSTLYIRSDVNGGISISLTCDSEYEEEDYPEILLDGPSGNTYNP